MTYDWLENIRAFKKAVHHAVTITENEALTEHHLNSFFKHSDQGEGLFSKQNFHRSLFEIERDLAGAF